jgi:hypothetical protein
VRDEDRIGVASGGITHRSVEHEGDSVERHRALLEVVVEVALEVVVEVALEVVVEVALEVVERVDRVTYAVVGSLEFEISSRLAMQQSVKSCQETGQDSQIMSEVGEERTGAGKGQEWTGAGEDRGRRGEGQERRGQGQEKRGQGQERTGAGEERYQTSVAMWCLNSNTNSSALMSLGTLTTARSVPLADPETEEPFRRSKSLLKASGKVMSRQPSSGTTGSMTKGGTFTGTGAGAAAAAGLGGALAASSSAKITMFFFSAGDGRGAGVAVGFTVTSGAET